MALPSITGGCRAARPRPCVVGSCTYILPVNGRHLPQGGVPPRRRHRRAYSLDAEGLVILDGGYFWFAIFGEELIERLGEQCLNGGIVFGGEQA